MTANSLSLQPPLAAGFARLGFGALPLERLKARYGNAADGSRYVELDGFNIHYRDEGSRDKPALVMIHGVVASLHTWDGWVPVSYTHLYTASLSYTNFFDGRYNTLVDRDFVALSFGVNF